MKLNTLGSNQTEIQTASGNRVLYSYSTPVAAYVVGRGYIRTATHYSATTSKHINKWLDGAKAETVKQSEIDALL